MSNLVVASPLIDINSIVGKIDQLKSRDHYICDAQGDYIRKMDNGAQRLFGSLMETIALIFRRAIDFCQTGEWATDRSLSNRLNDALVKIKVEMTSGQREKLSQEEMELLTKAYNDLRTRLDGKVASYTEKQLGLMDQQSLKEQEKKAIEQEQKIAQQEKKIADQEGRIADQEKRIVEVAEVGKKELERFKKTMEKEHEDQIARERDLQQQQANKSGALRDKIATLKEKNRELKNKLENIDPEHVSFYTQENLDRSEREKLQLGKDPLILESLIDPKYLNMEDTQEIFFKKGAINFPGNDEERALGVQQFKQILQDTYGKYLTATIWTRYELDHLKALTIGDLKKTFVAVAANVRKRDLKYLFKEIQRNKGQDQLGTIRCGDDLRAKDKNTFEGIQKKKHFSDLTSDELDFLLSAFRTKRKDNEDKELLRALFTPEQQEKFKTLYQSSAPLLADMAFLENAECWNKIELKAKTPSIELDKSGIIEEWQEVGSEMKTLSPEEHYRAAFTEYVGKTLAYNDLKKGMIVKLPEKDGSFRFYAVEDSVDNKGLISFLLVPMDSKNNDVHLIFRGTYSGAQMGRDVDYSGVGKKVFEDYNESVVKMLELYASKCKGKMRLHISGHSLGACDALRALVLFLERLALAEQYSPLTKIEKITTTTHNAPRPEPEQNLRMKQALLKMEKKDLYKDFEIDLLHIRWSDLKRYDFVSTCGTILLGADDDNNHVSNEKGESTAKVFASLKNIKMKRALIDLQIEKDFGVTGLFDRHCFRAFNPTKRGDLKWSVKDKFDEKRSKELNQQLACQHYWDKNDLPGLTDKISANMNWYLNGAKDVPFYALQWLLDAMVKPMYY